MGKDKKYFNICSECGFESNNDWDFMKETKHLKCFMKEIKPLICIKCFKKDKN